MYRIFIDGEAGTTGLRLKDRLKKRKDIELLSINKDLRKDINARLELIDKSDIAFLCLPDEASKEIINNASDISTTIIDTSTAHRVSKEWIYGFPEINNYREDIKKSNRIANPGCHATGFIALINPLINNNILLNDINLSVTSITGYTGGGKKMIAEYESDNLTELLKAPRLYGLSQIHKHLPEMVKYTNIQFEPVFCPIVAPYPCGMETIIPLNKSNINGNIKDIIEVYKSVYTTDIIRFVESADESGFMSASKMNGFDNMEISVCGNNDRILLIARFDNLGKGASGAAIQNMNIALGIPELTGLSINNN